MNLRDRALRLMEEWTASDSLRKHMLAVEAAVVAYARRYGADEGLWAARALVYDCDYERHPEGGPGGCPAVGVRYLRDEGWPDELCLAILGHAGDELGVIRESDLASVLYACDEITGLITAAVLVRPDRDISQVKLSSLKKKCRSKEIAAGVDRGNVEQ